MLEQLLYSEVFSHPLTKEELLQFSALYPGDQKHEIETTLDALKEAQLISESDGFYSVFEPKNKIDERRKATQKANELLPKAMRVAAFIHKFPFVEGVGISGSLSKGILHSDGDFDYFIITRPNRVWLARTLLILYKKAFLFNSRKYFCVNYFIDSEHLEIEEKNRFTAVEIATLIPAVGEVFNAFYTENEWLKDFFPQGKRTDFETIQKNKPALSRSLEFLLRGRFGSSLDRRSMAITFRRWKRKFGDFDASKFDLTMKSRPYVSKHHPNDFQNKVLNRFEALRKQYQEQHESVLAEQNIRW